MESLLREIKKLTKELETEREKNKKPIDYMIAIGNHKKLIKENQALKEQNESLHIIATEGARKRLQLKQENNKLKEQLDTLDQECASRMNKEQESELLKENKALKEELDVWVNPTGDVVMNREGMMLYEASQEENKQQDEIITKLCDMIRGLVPDPHADALIDEAYGENE